MRFLRLTNSRPPRIAVIVLLALVAGGVVWWIWSFVSPWLFPPNPLLVTPQLALEELQSRSLYFNGTALPWLRQLRPELLVPEDMDTHSARSRAFVQAPQSPSLFRQLDRQYRFDTVLLLGDPSNYLRLLDHLLEPEPEKRDFRLVYLDHWAFVFKRGAAHEWQPADSEELRRKLAGLRSKDQGVFLAQAAGKMLAIRQVDAAKRWLDAAAALNAGSVDVLSGLARYETTLGRWQAAAAYADKALEKDENCVPAMAAKIMALRGTGRKLDAFNCSEKLNKLLPEDPVRLWQHAQLAHEARRTAVEIKALTRLVELARQEGRPVSEYEFFLGEAHVYAAIDDAGEAATALKYLRSAISDPLLSSEKRKFAEERIAIIRERTGLK